MRTKRPTSFASPLFVSSVLLALSACGPQPMCASTGKNLVAGAALATTSGENCVAAVGGTVDDHGGETSISVACAPPTVQHPRLSPSRKFAVVLPDPRAWDSKSPVRATESVSESGGGASTDVTGPVTATFAMVDSGGAKAPLPSAASDDFVRHATVHITNAGGADVSLDVTIRASDLRMEETDCAE